MAIRLFDEDVDVCAGPAGGVVWWNAWNARMPGMPGIILIQVIFMMIIDDLSSFYL